jgi:hypothetical protein
MAYIGQSIKNGTFKDLGFTGTFNSSTTDFNLGTQLGSAAQILVSKNGVIQRPGTDFTLASGGSQISFTTAPASGDSIFIVEISGAVGGPMNRDINGDELILDVDGDTSITADTDDQIDIKIAGADDFKFSANAMNVLSGSTLTIDSGATITNSGTANGFSKIAQVVNTTKTDTFSSSSGSYVDVTGVSAAITPSATSSKIFVILTLYVSCDTQTANVFSKLVRGSTQLQESIVRIPQENQGVYRTYNVSMTDFDSPSSTSEQTYKLQMLTNAGTFYVNRAANQGGFSATHTVTLTLMEVLA